MPDETDLQKLLRLKRHEQPPPGYFEDFLREFQKRQREEMLRQPVWQVALDRVHAFVGRFTWSQVAHYAATAAIVLTAGVASWNILSDEPAGPAATVAATRPHAPAALVLDSEFLQDSRDATTRQVAGADSRPHYVMEARPVSYEPPFSF